MERKKSMNGVLEAKEEGPTWPLYLAAWDHPIQPLWPQLHRSFAPKHPHDLKTTIRGPPTFFQRRAATREKPENRDQEAEDRRGKTPAEPCRRGLHLLHRHPWWRGSSPPLDYGFAVVAYVSLSLLSFISSTVWVALHEYGHRCITIVVDLSMS